MSEYPRLQYFLVKTFPDEFPRARPSYIFYDNNCKLLAHLMQTRETRFRHTGMPVDVFHAANKHSETDEFCQRYCNPAAFPEIQNDRHEWLFNSSICEQTNVWFGRFMPIVREMLAVNYNFFLDEMIAIYNDYKEDTLAKRGKNPRLVPVEELRLPRNL